MKQILLLYFLLLPLQLVAALGYNLVLVCVIAAAALFGVDAIATGIEDPFGDDVDDLDIAGFCEQLKEDVDYIVEASESLKRDMEPEPQSPVESTSSNSFPKQRKSARNKLYKP